MEYAIRRKFWTKKIKVQVCVCVCVRGGGLEGFLSSLEEKFLPTYFNLKTSAAISKSWLVLCIHERRKLSKLTILQSITDWVNRHSSDTDTENFLIC